MRASGSRPRRARSPPPLTSPGTDTRPACGSSIPHRCACRLLSLAPSRSSEFLDGPVGSGLGQVARLGSAALGEARAAAEVPGAGCIENNPANCSRRHPSADGSANADAEPLCPVTRNAACCQLMWPVPWLCPRSRPVPDPGTAGRAAADAAGWGGGRSLRVDAGNGFWPGTPRCLAPCRSGSTRKVEGVPRERPRSR